MTSGEDSGRASSQDSTRDSTRASRAELGVLALVLVLAALLRGLYLVELSGTPDFEHPSVDAGFHDDWARGIAFADWEGRTYLPDPEIATTPYLRPPGYPYLLAAVYRVSGGSFLAPRIVQALLGVLTCALLFGLARRLVGTWGWRPAGTVAGAAAAIAYGSSWVPIYFEGELHAPSLLVALLTAHWTALSAWARRPGPGRAALAGLLLGAACITRPNVLVLAPVALVWGAVVLARRGGARRAAQAIAFLAALALAIAPVTLRNWRASGEAVPITTGLGVNLYLGNHPTASGRIGGEVPGVGRFDTCYDYPALVASLEQEVGRSLSHSEVSAWFAARALESVRAEPARALALTFHKLRLMLGAEEISHNKVLAFEREHSRVLSGLPGPFPVYLAGALLGCAWWVSDRRRRSPGGDGSPQRRESRELGLLLCLSAAALVVSLLPFFAAARYRAPLWPLACLFAGYAIARAVEAAHARAWARVAVPALGFVLLATGLVVASPAAAAPDLAKWHSDRGRALRRAGAYERAEGEYARALAVRPPRAQVHYEYALLLLDMGRRARAAEEYRRAIELDPEHLLAHYNLGTLLAEAGEVREALAYLEAAVRIDPLHASSRRNLAKLHLAAGDPASAAAACRGLLEVRPGDRDTILLLATCLERLGERDEAVHLYEGVLALDPGDREAARKLAWLLATSPEPELRDGPRALALARGLTGGDPGPEALGTLAAALAETGAFEQALEVAERALGEAQARGQGRRAAVLRSVLEACRAGRPVRMPR